MTGKSLARATAATIPAVEHVGRILQRANYQFRTLPREWTIAGQPVRTYDLARPLVDALADRLLRTVDPPSLVVDVGANIGVVTCTAAAKGCEVRAVEPNPFIIPRLAANVDLNAPERVGLSACALSDRSGIETLYCSSDHRRTALSADRSASANDVVRRVEVPVSTLDALLAALERDPDHIKLDVEGAEREVLDGGAQALAGSDATLWIETHHGPDAQRRLADVLGSLGFNVERDGEYLIGHP